MTQKATTKVQKTLAQTIDQLGKDIARMEKKVAAMRRRVGAAIRKHEKLQARITKLQSAGRIIWMNKDAQIVAGDGCHYVKAESLNVNADADGSWYYQVLFIEEYGVYQCSCENERQADCKHAKALGAYFYENVEVQVGNTLVGAARKDIENAVSHTEWCQKIAAEMREEPARKAEREARLQREADEMIACASRKYDAPLNGRGGFQLMR